MFQLGEEKDSQKNEEDLEKNSSKILEEEE